MVIQLANDLYNLFNNTNTPNNSPFGNVMKMMNDFNSFRNNFKGNPKAEVQRLLNSGAMSQSQYNELQKMASMFQQMIK